MAADTIQTVRGRRDLVCFAHLRWDWVYQRPQHILSRLARDHGYRVFYIEEPLAASAAPPAPGAPGWTITVVAPGVIRCVPRFAAEWPFFLDEAGADTRTMRHLLARLIDDYDLAHPVAWLYTPLATPLLRTPGLAPRAVVYDCMDELSLFAGAPPELRTREAELLRRADVVFTGGRSMHEARRGLHPNLHLFPSSIDVAHFAAGGAADTRVPPDARPGTPTFGFYGVLDERLDRDLLDAIAARRPEWSFVLVGPVAKIPPSSLPRRPNLHYPGRRAYADLPGYLRGWDACLMPFARNDATRAISPTKTLEYLAAGKPVVSTPIPDVVAGYQGVVHFGAGPDQFLAACEAALGETPQERARRGSAAAAILARTSWAATVARMVGLIAAIAEDEHRVLSLAGVYRSGACASSG